MAFSVGRVLREMAAAYREHWRFLLGTGLLLFVPLGAVEALEAPVEIDGDLDSVTAVEVGALGAAQAATSLVATVLYAGIVSGAVTARRESARPSLRRLARELPYLRLIAADLLLVLAVAAGIVLLVVPGLVLLTWFALAGPAIEVEHRGALDAFRRSRALVRRRFFRVGALVLPAFFAESAIASAAESSSVWALGETFAGDWAGFVLANLIAAPIFALAVVVLFLELRASPPALARS